MACSHDGFTHTSCQFTASLCFGRTRVVPQNRASVSFALVVFNILADSIDNTAVGTTGQSDCNPFHRQKKHPIV